MLKGKRIAFVGSLLLGAVLTVGAWGVLAIAAEEDRTAQLKGIFLDRGKTGVEFAVLLERGDSERRVSTSHRFRSGDRMLFQFKVNRKSYVYVLNRTMAGHPDDLRKYHGKGIDIVRDEDRRGHGPRGSYRLLFPTREAGRNNRLSADTRHKVPHKGYFVMDEEPGIEKIYLMVSEKPIGISDYFDLDTGRMRGGQRGRERDRGQGRQDTEDDVLDQLNAKLVEWSGNADVAINEPEKGIKVESYGIIRESSKPMMVEVDLKHYPK